MVPHVRGLLLCPALRGEAGRTVPIRPANVDEGTRRTWSSSWQPSSPAWCLALPLPPPSLAAASSWANRRTWTNFANQSIPDHEQNTTHRYNTTQQLPGCMAADGLNTRGGLNHSWLPSSSSSSSRPLLRPPARPCLIPTTTRMMMHQQRGGMQWLLKWCLVGLSLSLLMVVAVPSAGAASVSTRESADLRDEVGFDGFPGIVGC